jgi:hypothetical protein
MPPLADCWHCKMMMMMMMTYHDQTMDYSSLVEESLP